jgi:cardiolipin synthase
MDIDSGFRALWSAAVDNRTQLVALVGLAIALGTTAHIVLNKRDARSAGAWTGVVWLVPFVGAVLYLVLGINRIHRRARQLTQGGLAEPAAVSVAPEASPVGVQPHTLAELVGRVTGLPLVQGNAVRVLEAPDAFEAMLNAVEQARSSVFLATYIFGNDAAGHRMVAALRRAVERGVKVRVLVDGMGSLYSFPPVVGCLRSAGVPTQRFLYSLRPWRMPYMNLRNHRKLLVVDQTLGFTGGMNLRQGYLNDPPGIRDLHVRVEGPVVAQLLSSFAIDWHFSCGEWLEEHYTGSLQPGHVNARVVTTGPDADLDKRRLALLAALGRAEHRVRIITPYFVPDLNLATGLQLAVLRGIRIQLLLPANNNLRFVDWASQHILEWLVQEGLEVAFTPGCFDHSKLMTVDGSWSLLGSGNWDARSLRLNFELDLECYDPVLAYQLDDIFERRWASAVAYEEVVQPGWFRRLRNALAHLLEPYL